MANENKNVVHSFYARVKTQLADAGETVIYHPYSDMKARSDTDWIVAYVPVKTTRPSRLGTRIEQWFFELNCFSDLETANMYKCIELSDLIYAAFDQVTFALQDFETGGDPTIGYIRCSEVDLREVINPTNPELHQINSSFTGFIAI